MTLCHLTVLPMKVGSILPINYDGNHQQTDLIVYQRLISKLKYLGYRTCLNITFVIRQFSCHNSDPRVSYLRIIKEILCYSKKTFKLGIKCGINPASHWVKGRYGDLGVVRYTDSTYTGDLKERKLVIGYCFFHCGTILTWCSKWQRKVSMSTLEVDYVAVIQGFREGVWIWKLLNELLSDNAVREMKMLDNNKTSLILMRDSENKN